MGRKRSAALAAALLLTAAGTAAYITTRVLPRDHTPPQIQIEQEQLELSVSQGPQELLQGVTARDQRDGDVTDGIVVEQIGTLTPEHTAKVTYAAFDRSGNVAKASRTIHLTDYEPPRFGQKQALVIRENSNEDVLTYMSARDLIDGDISGQVKGNLVSDTVSLSKAGVHQVEFRVTNSMGDTARITLPVDVLPAMTYQAEVNLTDYLVYVPKGSFFRAERYLKSLEVGSISYPLDGSDPDVAVRLGRTSAVEKRHTALVEMKNNVNTAVPGLYSVTYTVTLDDQYTGFTRLNVVVEE